MVSQAVVLDLLARLRDYVEKLRPFQARSEHRSLRDGLGDFDQFAECVRLFLSKES